MRNLRRLALLLVSPLALTAPALAAATAAPAASPPPAAAASVATTGAFIPDNDFALSVDGKLVPAEFFLNTRTPGFLVISSGLPSPVIVRPGVLTVESLPLAKVTRRPDGSLDLAADAKPAALGKATTGQGRVSFAYGKQQVELVARPAVLGPITGTELQSKLPRYRYDAARYAPDAAAIAALKKAGAGVTVHVVFGSWCPHCKLHVPQLLRVEKELAGSGIKFDYHGIPQDWKDPEVQKTGVKALPTVVVSRGGKELGRLLGTAWEAPEVFLRKLLAPAK